MNARRLILSATFLTFAAVAAFSIAPAGPSPTGSHNRLSAGVFLRVLDNEADTSEGLNLPTGAIERPDVPVRLEATFKRGSGCWWLWQLITGIKVC